jgi:hypothetical protein
MVSEYVLCCHGNKYYALIDVSTTCTCISKKKKLHQNIQLTIKINLFGTMVPLVWNLKRIGLESQP